MCVVPFVRALLIEAAKSPFFKSPFELGLLLQRPVFTLIENGFCTDRTPNLQPGSETRRVWEWSFLQRAMEPYVERQQGSTPPTHLAPEKHAQTPTTHAHWIHR